MKVLLINKYHYLKGGAERAYFDMARILSEHGHEVAFFSMHHQNNVPTKWSTYFVSNKEYLDEKISFFQKVRLSLGIIFSLEAQRNLEKLLKEWKPDVAHAHNIYHQLSPSIFSTLKKYKVPTVMTLHDYKLLSPNYSLFVRGKIWEHTSGTRCITDRAVKDSYMKSFVCALEKWWNDALGSYRKVDTFVSPSRFLIEKFHSLGFQQPIEYLPNSLSSAPASLGLQRIPGEYLFFGRLSAEKGVETMLRALVLLPEEKKLMIAGDGPEKEFLFSLAEELGIRKRVTFLGTLSQAELEPYKQRAEAILLPSVWYENFPYTMIESLQSGCVVIASDQGGFRERIKNGENGFLFEAGNALALANVLRSLDGQNLNEIRKKATESVADLDEQTFYTRLAQIYEKVTK